MVVGLGVAVGTGVDVAHLVRMATKRRTGINFCDFFTNEQPFNYTQADHVSSVTYGMCAADWASVIFPPTDSPLGTEAGMVWLRSSALGDVSESRKAISDWTSSSDS